MRNNIRVRLEEKHLVHDIGLRSGFWAVDLLLPMIESDKGDFVGFEVRKQERGHRDAILRSKPLVGRSAAEDQIVGTIVEKRRKRCVRRLQETC